MIELLEAVLERKAVKNYLPMQPGDIPETFADIKDLFEEVGYEPSPPLRRASRSLLNGIGPFIIAEPLPSNRDYS